MAQAKVFLATAIAVASFFNCDAAPKADLVTFLPGFGDLTKLPYKIYSGYLTVPGPFKLNDYDSLEIHYQLQTSKRSFRDDPLVTWHQGGPGGSSVIVGLYTEMGALQIDNNGPYFNNEYAWNNVANMLYLESPAGSGQADGYSACIKNNRDVPCSWDDVSQAEAYAHTLRAFKTAFSDEFTNNDLYLTGESYFGQYGPNIANYIVSNPKEFSSLNLKGMALGNACWGGNETFVLCNGPNADQNDADMYYGKGLVSRKLYQQVYEECNFSLFADNSSSNISSTATISYECNEKLEELSKTVGPHNPYFIYDTCKTDFLNVIGKSTRWYKKQIIDHLPLPFHLHEEIYRDENIALLPSSNDDSNKMKAALRKRRATDIGNGNANAHSLSSHGKSGGYSWSCGGMTATNAWITRDDVRQSLHLNKPNRSEFSYEWSGPASITLYPSLIKKLRILIYNGDSDGVVPYKGNEEWISMMETMGVIREKEAWRPWFEEEDNPQPAGYVTSYSVTDPETDDIDFHFLTIRLAGHMVPTYQPGPSLSFFERFLASKPY